MNDGSSTKEPFILLIRERGQNFDRAMITLSTWKRMGGIDVLDLHFTIGTANFVSHGSLK
jgi:hypothetical protein